MPFIDLPDQTLENVYYYRWRVAHEAQKYTGAKNGWIVTEFLGPVFYSAPYGGISAAAGHHIAEARWIRDQRYLDDYIRFWLTGDGASAKPANDSVNPNTTDWAHEYSFWAGSAVLQRVKVTGNVGFAIDLLPQLIAFYNGWSGQFNQQLGLYWQTPVWDAMEYSASSYQSPDPYHGGDGYRPTINAYQFGDAKAISLLAALKGDLTTSIQFIGPLISARSGRLATSGFISIMTTEKLNRQPVTSSNTSTLTANGKISRIKIASLPRPSEMI